MGTGSAFERKPNATPWGDISNHRRLGEDLREESWDHLGKTLYCWEHVQRATPLRGSLARVVASYNFKPRKKHPKSIQGRFKIDPKTSSNRAPT